MRTRKTPPHLRRGFNLIEAAIVLGVVGLVIGGIWVASAAVSENLKVSEMQKVIVSLGTTTNQGFPLAAYPQTVMDLELSGFLIAKNAIPPNFIKGTSMVTPWNTPLSSWACNQYCVRTPSFTVSVSTPNTAICRKLTASVTSAFRDNSILYAVEIGSGVTYTDYTTFPLSPTGTQCDRLTPPYTVEFQFAPAGRL